MNIQIMSDLHFEFHTDDGLNWITTLNPENIDVLILAGDISVVSNGKLEKSLTLFCQRYPHVVFVPGNHEYYGVSVEEAQHTFSLIDQKLSNLSILQESVVYIQNQRFVGSTLWFDYEGDGLDEVLKWSLNDFRKIENFDPWVYHQNQKAVDFLINEVTPDDVVITHHIPDIRGVHPKWTDSVTQFGRFFIHQLPPEVITRPKVWCHGHGHDSMRSKLNGSELIANPFGYLKYEENPNFDPHLIVSL